MQSRRDIFRSLDERERRDVFDKPLSEVVRLLEFNLLESFWQTELRRQGVHLRTTMRAMWYDESTQRC